jgi:hypothetical protein
MPQVINYIMNIYRIYPFLWNDGTCQLAQTVYAIDRQPSNNTIPTCCSRRPKEDPAYYYDTSNTQRLLPPPNTPGCCYQPSNLNAVTWAMIPAWLSYVQSVGYTVTSDLSRLKPYSDIYITGP